jgi:hypothetical protein
MSIIGKSYEPFDNSFCIELSSKNSALIVQPTEYDLIDGYNPGEELGATFIITSEPYTEMVSSFIGDYECEFINVKSSKTHKEYRTLHNRFKVQ